MKQAISIHPDVDKGIKRGSAKFKGGTLRCHCANRTVMVTVGQPVRAQPRVRLHQVLEARRCALLAGRRRAAGQASGRRPTRTSCAVVDPNATIKRYACTGCGVHMYGRIDNDKHPFYGLDFIHTELSPEKGWAPPKFAAFVSSIIESGADPADMKRVRARLKKLRLEPYDCLSPELMDAIATHAAKAAGVRPRAQAA